VPAGTRSLTLRFSPDSWYSGPYIAQDFALFATSGSVAPTATPTRTPTATPSSSPSHTATPTSTAPPSGVSLTGTVIVQGRPSAAGVRVHVSPGGAQAITGPAGTFTIDGLQSNIAYTVTAGLPGFLDATRTNLRIASGTAQIGSVVLRAGDVDADRAVTVTDVSLIAGLYGTSATPGAPTDLTGNGAIDITDVSLVAGNYGLFGPTAW
jgi:hypothetical protein